jgi:serine/threonine protein kinase
MTLSAGDRLGPYEILAPIGKGGMGEVYRARDTRLGREVAIKVSAEQFSERFEREARAVAALNHPNICTLHDVGPNYLVMEYIEGEPPKGPLPLEEALKIARQIGDALEAAHEKGIVHRDLKPGNIKIKSDGTVKVLDFGLAKFGGTPTVRTEDSPTLSMAATQAGMILGTAGYMSPEQARGKEVDKRADIWAFGVVLYEMLTGDRLFEGETVSDTLAAVLRKEPDLGRVPLKAKRLVRRCLEKDPKNRLRDVADAWPLLEQGPEAESSSRSKLPWAVAGVLSIALLVVSFVHLRETPPTPMAMRLPVALPEFGNLSSLALSPDGRTIVLAASPTTGQTQLYLRTLDSAELRPLSGTQAARTPFWSADGRSLGFFADGKLKIASASGGPVRALCDAGLGYGGTWNHDGVILFGNTTTRQIVRVSATGGACTPVLTPQGNIYYAIPVFLPDGLHFFYVSRGGEDESQAGVYIASLDNLAGRRVLADQSSVIFAPPNPGSKLAHLLFLRETTLMAQPFDPGTLQPTGDVFPVAPQASFSNTPPQVAAAVGANDVLVYISNRDPDHQLA